MLPINKKISKYNFYKGNDIKYIIIHDVGSKSTAKNNVDYFAGGNRNASAHYFVDDTSIWQSVEDHNGAWSVGDGGNKYGINNTNSIGIEMCLPSGTVTAKTEQNTLELVKYLMAKYNVPADRVVRHYDASRKNCPAQFNLDGKWTRWYAFKAKLEGKTVTPPTVEVKPTAPAVKPAPQAKYKEESFSVRQVTDVALNVRKQPNTSSAVIKTLPKGKQFTPTKIVRNGESVEGFTTWCNTEAGWVSMAYTTPVKTVAKPAPKPVQKLKGENLPNRGYYKVTANTNIRSGAGTNHRIVGTYAKGQGFNYDRKVIAGGYVWLSYISYSGQRRYVAVV
ncbi:N-acetylmuramoyl-L-alanine amidase [Enterococcus olivae]